MKNKILLGSVTLLSALMVAACGNGEKKTAETMEAPTTEAAKETTVAPTTTAQTTITQSNKLETLLLKRKNFQGRYSTYWREDTGYVNVPKDWVVFKASNTGTQFQYSSPDKYDILTMNAYTKETVKLNSGETFGAELVANRLYSHWQNDKEQSSLKGVKTKFAGEEAFLMKVSFTDGKDMYEWVFQKGDKVYTIAIEGKAETLDALRPILNIVWSRCKNSRSIIL